MSNDPRGSSGRSGSQGDDPTLPETQRDRTAQVLVAEPLEASDEVVELEASEFRTPFAVRMDTWRRHYLPLPDEVVHEYLGEDEYVVHSDHPSFRAFLIKNGFQVLGLGVVGLLFLIFVRGGFDWWTILIFLVLQLVLAFLALKRLSDRYTSYVITNLRLIRLSGVFGRKLSSIPWTRMTGLGYTQKPLGRLLGYATIFIESANEESGLREFSDINDPAAFHQKILDMISSKSGQSTREPPPATRGERKGFLQRRRERRALGFERARKGRQAMQRGGPASSEPEPELEAAPPPLTDTGGVYEALSTSDTGSPATSGLTGPPGPPGASGGRPGGGRGSRAGPGQPSSGPRAGATPAKPTRGPTTSSTARAGSRAEAAAAAAEDDTASVEASGEEASGTSARGGRRWLWPGGGTGAKAGRPTKARGQPARPAQPTQPTQPTRPAKVVPSAEPLRAPAVNADEDDRDDTAGAPNRRRPRAGWIWGRREPPLGPPSTPPSGRSTGGREAGTHDEGTSAADALASIRRGQRPVRPIRRPRLPTFGRRTRPTFPESRQLPAAPENRSEDTSTPPSTDSDDDGT